MIKDTSYSLELRLRRIESLIATDSTAAHDPSVDLNNERDVTMQCLRICQDAQSYLDSLQSQQPSLRQGAASTVPDAVYSQFEAVLKTSRVLNENQESLTRTIGDLQQRLRTLLSSDDTERSRQEDRFRADIDMSRRCLEVCKLASEQVRFQKIHTIGEVVSDDDTDQVVVTTVADLFDVRRVLAKSRTSQIVGSMSDETLLKALDGRHRGQFSSLRINPEHGTPTHSAAQEGLAQPATMKAKGKQPQSSDTGRKASPNEIRKRTAGGEGEDPKFGTS